MNIKDKDLVLLELVFLWERWITSKENNHLISTSENYNKKDKQKQRPGNGAGALSWSPENKVHLEAGSERPQAKNLSGGCLSGQPGFPAPLPPLPL